jgi:hypothetical protein
MMVRWRCGGLGGVVLRLAAGAPLAGMWAANENPDINAMQSMFSAAGI